MEPGESPIAFFLRTKASKELQEVANKARAAEADRKDSYWRGGSQSGNSRVDFVLDGVHVDSIPGKGRGIRSRDAITAGTVVLRERALVSTEIRPVDLEQPLFPVVRLAAAALEGGHEPSLRALEPRPGREYAEHPARARREAEMAPGLELVRGRCPGIVAFLSDSDIHRLLLAVSVNSRGLVPLGGRMHQCLFPEIGAMVNHCSCPNVVAEAVVSDGGDIQLVLRCVRNVNAGEELCLTYLDELYLPFPERDERLQDMYGFSADRLPTDALMEARMKTPDGAPADILQRVIASNSAAYDAWEATEELRSLPGRESDLRRQRAVCCSHYANVLNANILAETHAWRYNATWRLASLLTQDGSSAACKKALPLWASALRTGLRVWPSENWPEHQILLKGALKCATAAEDEERKQSFSEQLLRIEKTMEVTA